MLNCFSHFKAPVRLARNDQCSCSSHEKAGKSARDRATWAITRRPIGTTGISCIDDRGLPDHSTSLLRCVQNTDQPSPTALDLHEWAVYPLHSSTFPNATRFQLWSYHTIDNIYLFLSIRHTSTPRPFSGTSQWFQGIKPSPSTPYTTCIFGFADEVSSSA